MLWVSTDIGLKRASDAGVPAAGAKKTFCCAAVRALRVQAPRTIFGLPILGVSSL
jgi:hypothetical protein